MSEQRAGQIIASEAARATLAAMKARHGAIILHVTGGWSKAALVLPSLPAGYAKRSRPEATNKSVGRVAAWSARYVIGRGRRRRDL